MTRPIVALGVALVAAFSFWKCNVADKDGSHLLTVNLSDSLKTYDSVLIVVKKTEGPIFLDSVVKQSDYGASKAGKFPVVLNLGDNPPTSYDILITTYKDGKSSDYEIKVKPGDIGKPTPISKGFDRPLDVKMVTVGPRLLATQGAPEKVVAKVVPATADQALQWETGNSAVATVDVDGTVHPYAVGETDIVARSKADMSLSAAIHIKVIIPPHVESVSVTPDTGNLYVGGETLKLTPHIVTSDGSSSSAIFSTPDSTLIKIIDGVVTGLDSGLATVKVGALGDSIHFAFAKLYVVKDVPKLNVNDDRSAKKGEELTFNISVTQNYGGIAALSWDLDGDGKMDDTVKVPSASPKHVYTQDTTITVTYYVRDTEGNEVTLHRKVIVGSNAPFVVITKPGIHDTIVNTPSITVQYTVDGVPKTKAFDLQEGPNTLVVSETNSGGTGTDDVAVTLDTKAPVVKITSPAESQLTNKSGIPVTWTVDGVSKSNTEDLTGKQGPIKITREAVDSAGNRGADTVTIVRDTVEPLDPVFTSGTTASPTNKLRPTWVWAGGGGGNGTFRYTLDSGAAAQGKVTSFTPSQDLAQGNHSLFVQEYDSAGNLSRAVKRTLHIQTQGPQVKITSPADGLITRLSSVPVAWTIDGAVQTTRTSESLTGKQGNIKIGRETTDPAGNRGYDTVTIVRDTIAPIKPAFTARPPHYVNASFSSPVQWTWSRTGASLDSFLVAINGGDAVKQAGTSYLLNNPSDQTYVFEVTELDLAGNASNPLLDTIIIDKVAPPAPIVSGTTPTGTPAWTWSAGSSSTGNRRFRYRLSSDANYSAETANTNYTLTTGLTSKTYALLVQERDAAGNWSADGSLSIVVDRTGPSIGISSPSEFGRVANFNPTVTGTVSDANGVAKVEYKLNNSKDPSSVPLGVNTWSFTGNYTDGNNTVWIYAEDKLGNRDSTKINIYKYSNVTFVRKGAGGSGRSWEDAYSELNQALEPGKTYSSGSEIWVANGNYKGKSGGPDNYMEVTSPGIKILGGFNSINASVNASKRDTTFGATILSGALWINTPGGDPVTVDGFTISYDPTGRWGIEIYQASEGTTLKSIIVRGADSDDGAISSMASLTTLENCTFVNNKYYDGYLVSLSNNSKLINCNVVGNIGWGAPAIGFNNSLKVEGGYFKENLFEDKNFNFTIYFEEQSLTINNAQIQYGIESIYRTSPPVGTLNYGSGNKTIE